MKQFISYLSTVILILFAAPCAISAAADWPMYRHDHQRSSFTKHELPDALEFDWSIRYTKREPTWKDPLNLDLMQYDRIFEPIVAGGVMYIGFNDTDKIVAIDVETGEEIWRYYTEGPVRMPGAAAGGRVYFTSDDGRLYCLDGRTGKPVWTFDGAPYTRRILGNERLISSWPARGGVVIEDGTVYFGSGIFPFMGTFLYAVDAETGGMKWINDREGSRWTKQPHGGSQSFAGVAPQGSFAVAGDTLLVAGGRSVPAAFDKNTGEFRYFRYQDTGKVGGAWLAANPKVFFNHHRAQITSMYNLEDGKLLVSALGRYPVLRGRYIFTSGKKIGAYDIGWVQKDYYSTDKIFDNNKMWEFGADASGDLILAGDTLYAGGKGRITAVDISSREPEKKWTIQVDGKVERLIAASDRLFAVTLDGEIISFAEKGIGKSTGHKRAYLSTDGESEKTARAIIAETGVSEGYALFYGLGDPGVLEALALNSDLHIIAAGVSGETSNALRRRYDDAGMYGDRLHIIEGGPGDLNPQQYMASLTVVNGEVEIDAGTLEELYRSARPYGGKIYFTNPPAGLESLVRNSGLHGLEYVSENMLSREGPLEGAAPYTHVLGDMRNTGKSDDRRVKLPLGLLWFGGETNNRDVLPRHGHGPPEQITGGRLFIEGIDRITARDVYTGRQLWQNMFVNMDTYGAYYDESYKETPLSFSYNQEHLPGANIRGTNFIATEDTVYVINSTGGRKAVHRVQAVDAESGDWIMDIMMPETTYINSHGEEVVQPEKWCYIGVYEDLLIGTGTPVSFADLAGLSRDELSKWENTDFSACKNLHVFDRHSGELLWSAKAVISFMNNAIAAGNGRLYALDRPHPLVIDQFGRKGKQPPAGFTLSALDIRTGALLWKDDSGERLFGSFLQYSSEHDILLQSTRASRDTVRGEEGKRMLAYNASTGDVLWDKHDENGLYVDLPLIWHDQVISPARFWRDDEAAIHFSLLTGERLNRKNPVTGGETKLTWRRGYGCNHALGGENLVTFRSGAAGFYDLENMGGTGNFGGFKSGCTNTLIAADGVMNAPDYTRTCICAYSNQTSLALSHMPENEFWTFNDLSIDDTVKRLGINLGAPGDRFSGDTFWFEFPYVGYSTAKGGVWGNVELPVSTSPAQPECFTHHSSRFSGGLPWVAASGCEDMSEITISRAAGRYTLRLYMAEPGSAAPGDRVFDVFVNGRKELAGLDVVSEAGGARKLLVKTIDCTAENGAVRISFQGGGSLVNGIELISSDFRAAGD